METRFAGSRLEDRRRRRLAADSDSSPSDGTETTTSDWIPPDSPLLEGRLGRNAPARAIAPWQRSGPFPLVPRALWKHFFAATLCLLVGAGSLSVGGRVTAERMHSLPGVERLLARDTGTLYRAFPAALLFMAGQAALVIWWYRSRSVRDFDGRFRRWTQVAAACFLMSLCVGTEAHLAWSEACCAWSNASFWQSGALWWLAPAGLVTALIWLPLYRELQRNRLSIGLLLAATAMYLVAAAVRLRLVVLSTPEVDWMVLSGIAWLGHLLLGLCLSLHARHVMYYTAEPVERRVKDVRHDRTHFLWAIPTRWFRRAAAKGEGTEVGDGSKKERERKKPARAKTATKSRAAKTVVKSDEAADEDSVTDDAVDEDVEDTEPAVEVKAPVVRINSQPTVSAAVSKPAPIPVVANRSSAPQSAARDESNHRSVSQDRRHPERSDDVDDNDGANFDGDGDGDSDDADDRQHPDTRGMSKKQRRKLMRELRDRDQQASRR